MDTLHSLGYATVIALGTLFSGIGMFAFIGGLLGTNSVKSREYAMLGGLLFGLFMLFCLIWLAYNGTRL